jgi:hypothetical protein
LLPQPIVQELLSIAHLQAVAAQAGISVATFDRLWRKRSYRDFGIDGHFRKIAIVEDRRFTYGYGLDFQLKSSVKCVTEELHIRYHLEAKTYNDFLRRDKQPKLIFYYRLSFQPSFKILLLVWFKISKLDYQIW